IDARRREAPRGSPPGRPARSAPTPTRSCASSGWTTPRSQGCEDAASSVDRSAARERRDEAHQDEAGPDTDQEPGEEVAQQDSEPDTDQDPARKRRPAVLV